MLIRIQLLLLTVLIFTGLLACSDEVTVPSSVAAIGVERLSYIDATRTNWQNNGPRPLKTTIWYPAVDGAKMSEMLIPVNNPVFSGGWASRGAPIKEDHKQRPLIIMSHGTGGSAYQLMWLGRRLASAGYIAAAIDHHGNTAAEDAYDARGFRLFWERAKDIAIVIDQLIADPKYGSVIDQNKIGAVGFSLGGTTVIAASGGVIDLNQLDTFCSSPERDTTCEPQNEYADNARDFEKLKDSPSAIKSLARQSQSFLDVRIKATVALAPALGMAFTKQSLAAIKIPVHIVVGEADSIAPNATNAQVLANNMPSAKHTLLEGGPGHYVFLNQCTSRGKRYVPICEDNEGVDRADVHLATSEIVRRHFDTFLGF
jgi:predicted dienelactone hydrolase